MRVNTVCPGRVGRRWTGMPRQELKEGRLSQAGRFPGGQCARQRFSEPADLACHSVSASDEAHFVTGVELLVDGGYVL